MVWLTGIKSLLIGFFLVNCYVAVFLIYIHLAGIPWDPLSRHDVQRQMTQYSKDIFWSESMERLIPTGMSLSESLKKVHNIKQDQIVHFETATVDRCGIVYNGFGILENGLPVCIHNRWSRYTIDDVLAFYLSLLLGMNNVPVVAVSKLNRSSKMWRHANYTWKEGHYVTIIEIIPFISGMGSLVSMPRLFRQAIDEKFVITKHMVDSNMSSWDLRELIQWGTMIIFDFLIIQLDRVAFDVRRMDNRYPPMKEKYIRNLRKSTVNQKYWLIDNEMAILHGYVSAYTHVMSIQRQFQTDMLHVMCIFQRSLVDRVRELNLLVEPHRHLIDFVLKHEPDYANIPQNYKDLYYFNTNFKKRIEEVHTWMENCAYNITDHI